MRLAISDGSPADHGDLNRLLDRTRFVGIRIFGKDKRLIYESWEDVPRALIEAAKSRQHEWPERGRSHTSWIEASDERLIQVVLPLSGADGELAGYLEGVNRRDRKTLETQRVQIRSGAISAAVSVLITAILLYPLLLAMLQRSAGLSRRLLDSNLSLMRSLGNAIAKRDSDTDAHNYRVTLYAVALAEAMELPRREIADLVAGAFLHDVGKIGIPDSILLKPGKLTDDEFRIMKTHALLGIEIVADNPWLAGAALTIRHHHERFDGNGYPDGLAGESIPLIARIFAVVDVFDALTSERPYKRPMGLAETLAIIESDTGRHFDPVVVANFIKVASNLYGRTACANEQDLQHEVREIIRRYFNTQTAIS
jgi:HD-GYP domain-containing protein (c-di-GMP phosphodiesterase class II)